MKLFQDFYEAPLFYAVIKDKNEIAKLLLSNNNIDINIMNVFLIYYFNKITILNILIILKTNFLNHITKNNK